jgi:hypothetical protein
MAGVTPLDSSNASVTREFGSLFSSGAENSVNRQGLFRAGAQGVDNPGAMRNPGDKPRGGAMRKNLGHRAVVVLCVLGGLGVSAASAVAITQPIQAQATRYTGTPETHYRIGDQTHFSSAPQVRHA